MGYYEETTPDYVLNVLGTNYSIYLNVPDDKDNYLKECSGYCDKSAKRISVMAESADSELADWDEYAKSCLRHELIHAFLYESGIDGNCTWDIPGEEHPEHMVAWIATQFHKLLMAFEATKCL